MFLQQAYDLLLLRVGFLRDGIDGERNLEEFCPVSAGVMVRNDDGNVDVQLVSTVPLKKVGQTVILFRDHETDTRPLGGRIHFVVHLVHFRDRLKGGRNIAGGQLKSIRGKFHSHEKRVCFFVGMVVGVENIAAEIVNEPRHVRQCLYGPCNESGERSSLFSVQSWVCTPSGVVTIRVREGSLGAALSEPSR